MSNQNNKPFKGRVFKKKEHRTNSEITHTQVRVTGDGIESTVVPIQEAIKMAEELGVDLVEIAPTATPPVCKIIEYSKYLYQLKKKKENSGTGSSQVKEIKIGPHIADNDMNVKVKKAIEILTDGNKVKLELQFRGREIVYRKEGEMKMLQFATLVAEVGKAESLPKLDGKKMMMMFSPKSKK